MIGAAACGSNATVAIRAGTVRLKGGRVISEARMRRRLVMRLLGMLHISSDCERDWDADDGIVALRSCRIGSEIWRGRLR